MVLDSERFVHDRRRPRLALRLAFAPLLLLGCSGPQSSAASAPDVRAAPEAPNGLLVELLAKPHLAQVTDPWPELGWIVGSSPQAAHQTAYQIQVAATLSALAADQGDAWDSGKVDTERSLNVSYAGTPLSSDSSYFWRVRTWSKRDTPSRYSQPQEFRTGTLNEEHATARYPLQQREVECIEIRKTAPGSYFIDFGKAAFGTLQLTLSSLDAPATLDLHFGEKLAGPIAVSREPGGTIRYRNVKLPVMSGSGTYVATIPPDKRNTRRAAILMPDHIGEVLPFRYVEIHDCPIELAAGNVRMLASEYPFDDAASAFQSSDPGLDQVYEFCKYSIRATTFVGVYVDGDRERIPYEADAYLNQLSHYAVDREFSLARLSHEYLLTHATWPTEWLLHSVLMAGADYQFTGDTESAAHWYEMLEHKTLSALAGSDGLLKTKEVDPLVLKTLLSNTHSPRLEDIVDWPRGERDGYVFTSVNTVVNAFHYRALVVMSELAAALGKDADAADFGRRAEHALESFNAKLFDVTRGVYVDGLGTDHVSLHANMMPLAFEMVPPEHVAKVADYVKGRGMACSVYGAQYLLEALYRANEADAALQLMTAEHDRSWLHMQNAVGSTISLEAWDQKYKPNLDWNHAWGAAPANIIPHYLVGVRPLEPGFKKILIKPQLGSLQSLNATVPTIRGPVSVRVERAESFTLHLTIPGNTTAEVHLPYAGGETDVLVDGNAVPGKVAGQSLVIRGLGPGHHAIVSR